MQWPFGTSVGAGSSPGDHSCFVAAICRSDVAPDSRVAQSVRQGSRERREMRILFVKSGFESSDGIRGHFVPA